ncbi:MAG: DEAD/DEAH box helicase [Chloroflexi bacterium]|nr:DEAD/DEAH box helicase [Chloroflexota bacterium]
MGLSDLFQRWKNDTRTFPNISTWRVLPARPAMMADFPIDLPPQIVSVLRARGIRSLYSHQVAAWDHSRSGENVILATGTASGKTLAYNLPVLAAILDNPETRALYLFPTKALTQDQNAGLAGLFEGLPGFELKSAIYDGDTPQAQRSLVRKKANIIFSNPDMVHTGILPHHTNWADFFRNLRYVVIDEMHTYRGVFGSHVANVIRRLKRIARFYGASPQFILTSATIANPAELAGRLIEAPVVLVDVDGSARGERHFLIYNPPVIDEALGLRKSAVQESVRLSQDLLENDVQSVVFARSRRSVEILLKYLLEAGRSSPASSKRDWPGDLALPASPSGLRGYRSGYLPAERREIEKGLRDGSVRLVVATNALELGIDIGGLGAAILVGYPGTIASVTQQSGRAGRGAAPAVSVLVATPNPLDQFLAHHPEYFFARSPEQALINPDHLLILLNHLRCALFEYPFEKDERFGGLDVGEFLEFLTQNNEAHFSSDKYFWMADAYPAASVSLRSASPENIILHAEAGEGPKIIGEVDLESAAWMVHPHAVYLHEGQQYFVQDLNYETHAAALIPVALDYFTEALRDTNVSLLSLLDSVQTPGGQKAFGDLQVTTQVTAFRKRMWFTGEILGQEPLDLPPSELQTTGYWITIAEETVEKLAKNGLWTNAPNDYGPEWPKIREKVRTRDGFSCQVCGIKEGARQHDVHHKIPFRNFFRAGSGESKAPNPGETFALTAQQLTRANSLDNLVTLCPECHRKAEQNVRMRSGLAGFASVLGQLAPLFLMCDSGDLGVHFDPQAAFADGAPVVVLYDLVPAGIGFSQKLFEMHIELVQRALELVLECPCEDGCPSCVGPAGENGVGGKLETLAILKELVPGYGS